MGLGKFVAGLGIAAVTGVVAGKKIVDKKIEEYKKKKEAENSIIDTTTGIVIEHGDEDKSMKAFMLDKNNAHMWR